MRVLRVSVLTEKTLAYVSISALGGEDEELYVDQKTACNLRCFARIIKPQKFRKKI